MCDKNVLVVYYSRTGVTRKVAEEISKISGWDTEEIVDNKDRSGAVGFIKSGRDAAFKYLTNIGSIGHDVFSYKVIIIGTPVWAFTMSPAVRTFIERCKQFIKNAAAFCTMDGSGGNRAIAHIESLLEKKLLAKLCIDKHDIKSGGYREKAESFVRRINT